MVTDSSRLYPNRSDVQLDWICSGLALFTLCAGLIAALAVFANDLYFWRQSPLYISPYLFALAFVLGASHRVMGLMVIIAILPLSAGLGQQFNAYLGTSLMTLPNQGLDLASGFFLGAITSYLVKAAIHRKTPQSILSELQYAVPWPVALVIVMVTCSTALAIARNIYQSATTTSVKGVLFNLVHFRPIDWHADFMPISDWIAYALAVSMVGVVIAYLTNQPHKVQIIFRPLIVGLLAAVLLAMAQAMTGIGLPEHLLKFRKDFFGYATIGFQPDLHAFAGHMLLGAIGLIGYLKILPKPSTERTIVQVTIALCWFGLVLSKSRALLLLALVTVAILVLYSIWKNNKSLFSKILIAGIGILILLGWLVGHYSNSFSGIPVLAWLGELANEFKSRDLTSWSLFSGIFGSRFEIWEAAIRMWWEFPLLGTGQGTFYRYSAIPSFSKSHFLILNNGENAHNYFLQTLTETGVIGILTFITVIVIPFVMIKNKNRNETIITFFILLSLFLGNIFSHTFLVRDNFILASIIFGYLWITSQSLNNNQAENKILLLNLTNKFHFLSKALKFTLLFVLIFSAVEAYKSFDKHPFNRGYYCYLNHELSDDGWTSGLFYIDLPLGSKKLEAIFDFRNNGLVNSGRIPELEVDLINSHVRLPLIIYKFYDHKLKKYFLKLSLENNQKIEEKNTKVRIRIQNCFTPRNLGFGRDGRRLGAYLDRVSL
jgi:O-antigen ligase